MLKFPVNVARAMWSRLPPQARKAVRQHLPPVVQQRLRAMLAAQTAGSSQWLGSPRVAVPRDPIPLIIESAEYAASCAYFAASGAPSLISPQARALLYETVRLLRPSDVVEIGAFRGGTTEALARALATEGRGTVHAIEPFVPHDLRRTVGGWPRALRERVAVYPMSSMQFFMAMPGLRAGVYLVDGNHDYEFATFDIGVAARRLLPGGMIFVDNVSQHGPFAATRTFLDQNPDFYQCGGKGSFDPTKPFDAERTAVPNTDLMVLRSEPFVTVQMARSFGEHLHHGPSLHRARIVVECGTGTLHAQAMLRGFGSQQTELVTSASIELAPTSGELNLELLPIRIEGDHTVFRSELWLTWDGERPLKVIESPTLE